jgi:ribose transport system ATP-binding protein
MEGITKVFSGTVALNNVDFFVKPGEIHGLVGANGAGKSTLMKVLTGVYKKDSGTIKMDNKIIEVNNPSDAQKNGIAMIYQDLSLIPSMTVAQNVFLQREKKFFGDVFINDKMVNYETKRIFDDFGIDIDPKAKVADLSVGYKQVVEIGKALSKHGEKVLVMDEPTASLSEKEAIKLFELIKDLKKMGLSIIYISHRMKEIIDICDSVTVLKNGKNVFRNETSNLSINNIIDKMIGETNEHAFEWHKRDYEISDKPLLEAKNLVPTEDMEPLNFKLYPGEIVGIAGLMGSGRTEIVESIFGINKPIKGEVKINGKKITNVKTAMKEGIALIPENRRIEGLVLDHSVRENIMLPNLNQFILKNSIFIDDEKGKKVSKEYVDRLDIKTESIEKLVKFLSGGNQQKVVLAKWLERGPKLIIFDEPTIGVDVGTKAEIMEIIRDIANQGVAVVIISSELSELMAVSDRFFILVDGKIVGKKMRNEFNSEEALHSAIQGA